MLQKRQFAVASPSASRPSIESALQKCFEKSGARSSSRDRRNAPVFQGGHQEQFKCGFVQTSRIWNFCNKLNSGRIPVFCMGKMSRKRVGIRELSSKN